VLKNLNTCSETFDFKQSGKHQLPGIPELRGHLTLEVECLDQALPGDAGPIPENSGENISRIGYLLYARAEEDAIADEFRREARGRDHIYRGGAR
jgi:hypothetical protein